MARHGHGNRVRGARPRHRARRLRLPESLRHFAVRSRCAQRKGLQIGPHTPLKGGGLNVERQGSIYPLACELAEQGAGPLSHGFVVALARREWEFALQTFGQLVIGAAKFDGADSFIGGSDQHAAQRRSDAGVTDGSSDRSTAVLVGRHTEVRRSALVKATAGTISGVVEGAGHVVPGAQILLQVTHPARVGVGFWTDSQCPLECALQMERALPKLIAESRQGNGLVQILFDEAANILHQAGLGIGSSGLRLAAQTGAKAGTLGGLRRAKEGYVFAARTLCRTRRPAVDAGGRDGKEKLAISAGIAGGNRVPPLLLRRRFVACNHVEFSFPEYRIGSHDSRAYAGWALTNIRSLRSNQVFRHHAEGP